MARSKDADSEKEQADLIFNSQSKLPFELRKMIAEHFTELHNSEGFLKNYQNLPAEIKDNIWARIAPQLRADIEAKQGYAGHPGRPVHPLHHLQP